MTAQIADILIHRGQELELCAYVLDGYLARIAKSRRPEFAPSSSANWRGYVATWEIRDDVLHLTAIEGHLKTGGGIAEATLERAFPWVKGTLPATWLSDRIRCPEGRLVAYAHRGFASCYERDRFFVFEKGRLTDEILVLNPPEPIMYRISSDGARTCIDGWRGDEIPDPLDGDDVGNAHKAWGARPAATESDGYVVAAAYVFPPDGRAT